MHKSALLCLVILITFGLLACTAGAANGNISGFKKDGAGNVLSGWNITLKNATTFSQTNSTDGNGMFSFSNLPNDTYQLNETPQCGWLQLSGNHTVTIDATNITFTNQNFTNQQLLGTINVTKYNDLNGNGQQDPGEPGLINWVINLTYAVNGTLYRSNVTTGNGNYTFTNVSWGTFNVSEDVKNGWTQTQPATDHYTVIIDCTNLNSTLLFGNHQNKIFGYKLDNQTGQGIPNWTINLYNNGNGNLLDTNTTNSSGYYEFFGGYTKPNRIYLVNETLQPGYVLISPLGGQYIVPQLNGSHLDEGPLNFTNMRLNGSINGYKLDQYGQGIPNWPINLTNQSGAPKGSMNTGSDGKYTFTNLTWDTYNVSEGSLPGYILGIPTFNNTLQVNGTNLNLGPVNFTNTRLNGSISGYKRDQSGNPLDGWEIKLYNESGFVNSNTTMGGLYLFENLFFGNYTVNETPQCGWNLTNPTGGNYSVALDGINLTITNLNFTNQQLLGTINVTKYNDLNGNGQQDPGEPGLKNWVINLTYAGNGTLYRSNQTDASGNYTFTQVPWGTYNVSEEVRNGWTRTQPATDHYTVIIDCTNLNSTLLFGNHQNKIFGYKLDNQTGQGIPGWTINLYNNANGNPLDSNTTNGSGYYEFSGGYIRPARTYLVNETLQPGYALISPLNGQYIVPQLNGSHLDEGPLNFTNMRLNGSINGYKLDQYGQGIPNWPINLTNQSGAPKGSMNTGSDGKYTFTNLTWDTYNVSEGSLPGYILGIPTFNNTLQVNGTNLDIGPVNFTNTRLNGSISGYKRDQNGNPIQNWPIHLTNVSGTPIGNNLTDGNGFFSFTDLQWDTYNVSEGSLPGYILGIPTFNNTLLVNGTNLNLGPVNFTNTRLNGSISGSKKDQNGNLLDGWEIKLYNESGFVTSNTTMGGLYLFENLLFGNYTVNETPQCGWNLTNPTGGNYSVTLDGINLTITNLNFTNTQALGNITVRKYNDLDGNGQHDPGEPGLKNWVINLTYASNGTLYLSNQTDANGNCTFINVPWGTYNISEEVKNGWTRTEPATDHYTVIINCTNLNTTLLFGNHQNKIFGYKLDNQNGQGIPGWPINLYNNANGNPLDNTTTNGSGYYEFSGGYIRPNRTYLVNETLLPGYAMISPPSGQYIVPQLNGTHLDEGPLNFTNARNEEFCIDGYKIDNCTGEGLEGWTIYVMNESDVVGGATTNETGYYQVCDLIPGNYIVCEFMQPGWMNLTPSCVEFTISDSDIQVNFTNTRQFCIEGYKFDQQTGLGLPDWTIYVTDESDSVLASAITDKDGFYQICGLIPGNYIVCEELQPGWVNITPSCVDVTLPCNNLTVNFTNMQQGGEKFCIDGYKIDNCTGEGLEGWNVNFTDEFGGTETATTDETGHYQVCGLLPGNYTVCEDLQDDWVNVTPLCVDVTIVDANVPDVNFTNTRMLCIEGHKILAETGLGLPGWNISVMDESGQKIGTAMTGEDGFYQVCDLIPGNYTVCEELQPGFINLTPLCVNVTLSCENRAVDFINDPAFCIEGYKIDNCTGLGVPDWTINVTDESGSLVGSATTDKDGFYQVCRLISGNYTVCEVLQPGWVNLTPSCLDVVLEDTNVNNVNFTNARQFCIEGYKIDGQTGLGLPGWNISVMDESGQKIGTAMTGEDGFYQVCGLIPGNYTVCEELQSGWFSLTPLCMDVTLPCSNLTVNFTNMQQFGQICGWVGPNCNEGGLYPPGIRVRFALNASDLTVPGRYFETTTDIRGVYCISGLPTGQILYGMAFSPLSFPDRYLERPIGYQIDNGKLIICDDSACTPQIPPLENNGTLQVNWVLTNNPSFFNLMPL